MIYSNILRGMQVLVDAAQKLGIGLGSDNNRALGQQLLAQGAGIVRTVNRVSNYIYYYNIVSLGSSMTAVN